jgi:putative tryptophan/tyrosine transport system substrate-binding protein
MRRREFITALGGAATVWSLAARAQAPEKMRLVGVLMAGSDERDQPAQARIAAFRSALQELGWTENRNVRFEIRWAGGNVERTRAFAAELPTLAPDVILAGGTTATAMLKQATSSIPLVFVIVNDPVAQGFVANVAHPGGNITGFSYIDYSVIGKALQLLKLVAPNLNRVGFMFNPDAYPYYETYLKSFDDEGHDQGFDLVPLRVHSEAEIKQAFASLAATPGAGIMAPPEPFTSSRRKLIVDLAAQYRLPGSYGLRDYVTDGGMMCYAPDIADIYERSAVYIDRVLKGAKPADLPVQAPTKLTLTINLKTAKALGLDIPAKVLALTDEVIE